MMKPVLHSVSYAGLWGQHRMSLEEFIPHAARLGFAGVMLMTKRPHLSALDYDRDKVRALAHMLKEYHLSVPCLAGYNNPGVGCSTHSFDHPFDAVGHALDGGIMVALGDFAVMELGRFE